MAIHRFEKIPNGKQAGLVWIHNAARKAGELIDQPENSKGNGGLNNPSEDEEFVATVVKAQVSTEFPPELMREKVSVAIQMRWTLRVWWGGGNKVQNPAVWWW